MEAASNAITSIFLVTANIASCFEKPEIMLNPWLDELLEAIIDHKPQFIAVHCQEVGGKHYESSSDSVHAFVSDLLKRVLQFDYTRARIFIDEDYTSADKFTALGNLYFIRSDVQDIQIWDFLEKKYLECEGIEKHVGCIEDITTKQKSKFPQEFFPECKWSRKGFLRTRWCINGTQIDLVNIHLFHDASNFIAMDSFPSVYSMNRKRAMEHTLDKFHNDEFDNVPFFIFGDFNFRLDTKGVIEKLSNGCNIEETTMNGERARLYKDENEKLLLSVSKKVFNHCNHSTIFIKESGKWLLPFDKELSQFGSRLFEYPVLFPPSYPFEEGMESSDGKLYMKTRCPSWCDRIILSRNAKCLLEKSNVNVKYNIIGMESRMGDHKPVGLRVEIPVGAGIVECCSPRVSCTNFVHVPQATCFILGAWCHCQAYPKCFDTPGSYCVDPTHSQLSACPNMISYSVESSSVNLDFALLKSQNGSQLTKEQQKTHGVEIINETNVLPENLKSVKGVVSSELKGADIVMKNLFKINKSSFSDINLDLNLKRVKSDPIKTRLQYDKLKNKSIVKSNLGVSHSLDSKSHSKLRLRNYSSRLVSHHSSSSEEWFEEIPPSSEIEKEPDCPFYISNSSTPSLLSGKKNEHSSQVDFQSQNSYYSEDDSVSYTASILRTPRFANQDNSLNNLLIGEGSLSQFDNESRSMQSDQTDEYYNKVEDDSKLLPCVLDVVSESASKPSDPNILNSPEDSIAPAKNDGKTVEVSASDCCCILS